MLKASRLNALDTQRVAIAAETAQEKKSELGQFLTPAPIAKFMADLLPLGDTEIKLLDPGAGIGALAVAVLERRPDASVTAYELDETLLTRLRDNIGPAGRVEHADFIEQGVFGFKTGTAGAFTHAILNPPYKKIATSSAHRRLLQKIGLETVNLYSGFVGLSLMLVRDGGHLCAIVPRSFCNGPYYKPFRRFILGQAAIKHMHLFQARNRAFADDGVLQENMILLLQRSAEQGIVKLSFSTDGSFSDLISRDVPFEHIVTPSDDDQVIHFPTEESVSLPDFARSLAELGIEVSTGPVVDFRLKDSLRRDPEDGAVPLLYPGHFVGAELAWPKPDFRKANAIVRNKATEKWLFPAGNYVVVRRFSSKEERRRIVASFLPDTLSSHPVIGIENHLNVFHRGRRGLTRRLALGLVTYLNSTRVDERFRTFNGHTQVNATDLRMLRYPSQQKLNALGTWAELNPRPSQNEIDQLVEECM